MARFVRNVGFALVGLAFVACGDAAGPKSVGDAEALWQSHNLSSYSYVATHQCFCLFGPDPVKVEVSQGQVSRVVVVSSGAEIATRGYYTIDELFDWVRSITGPATVTYDPTLGYPQRIEICCLADDSGGIYTVSGLSPAVD
jgi:hypothetical protein